MELNIDDISARFDLSAEPPTQEEIERWKEEAREILKTKTRQGWMNSIIFCLWLLCFLLASHIVTTPIGAVFFVAILLASGVVVLLLILDQDEDDNFGTIMFLLSLSEANSDQRVSRSHEPLVAKYIKRISTQGRKPVKGELIAIQKFLHRKIQ